MAYGLKEPEKTGVFPGNASVTADEALQAILYFGNELFDDHHYFKARIDRIYRYGVTKALIKELNQHMEPLAQSAIPLIDPTSHELSWSIKHDDVTQELMKRRDFAKNMTAEMEEIIESAPNRDRPWPHPTKTHQEMVDMVIADAQQTIGEVKNYSADYSQAFAAYVFAYFIDDGVFENLRRCERPECERYFIGGPRAKWCSTTCGSIVRVKLKRKRDRGVENLESRHL